MASTRSLTGSCLCGQVTIRVPGRPEYLGLCNCIACTKRGALWGYFPASQVEIGGETRAHLRDDIGEVYLSTHFCGRCGVTTHWSPVREDLPDRMGVNMRLFDPAELSGIEVRYGNMRDESDDAPRYYREPTLFGETGVPA